MHGVEIYQKKKKKTKFYFEKKKFYVFWKKDKEYLRRHIPIYVMLTEKKIKDQA